MKGQGAMEYLMTYGWALLVIVVVGAALFALGVLNPSTYTQKRCQGFDYFTYQDHVATGGAAGAFALDLVNGNRDITISSVNVTTATASWQAVPSVTAASAGTRFNTALAFGGAGPASGSDYSNMAVTIRYTVTGGLANVDHATCSGTWA